MLKAEQQKKRNVEERIGVGDGGVGGIKKSSNSDFKANEIFFYGHH